MARGAGVSHLPVLVFLSDGQPLDDQHEDIFSAMRSLCTDFPALQLQCVHFAAANDVTGQSILRALSECAGNNGTMRLAADSIQLQEEFAALISTINAQTATMRKAQ